MDCMIFEYELERRIWESPDVFGVTTSASSIWKFGPHLAAAQEKLTSLSSCDGLA